MLPEVEPKPLVWIGSSRKDIQEFPEEVTDEMGYALFLAQCGKRHRKTKVLKGAGDAGVLETVSDFRGDTFRTVYTVRFASAVYVLHAFQKESKTGIATPKNEMRLIEQRLREAERLYRESGHAN